MRYFNYGTDFKPSHWRNGVIRQHPQDTVIRTLRLCYKYGIRKAAMIEGLSFNTVDYWFRRRFLPKTGRYTFEKMLLLVTNARAEYTRTRFKPMSVLQHVTNRTEGMRWRAVKQYVYLQAMPTVPGFPLYADRMVNDKAELYGRGERKFSAVLGVEPPDTPAESGDLQSRTTQTGRAIAPRQKGRRFLVELQATTHLPPRYNDQF